MAWILSAVDIRARLDQIINLKHELVRLAGMIDWAWIDGELAGCFSDEGRPGLTTRFMVGLLLLKHIHGLSDEEVCARWVYDPYFQYFTGEEFFAQLERTPVRIEARTYPLERANEALDDLRAGRLTGAAVLTP